jgi:phosphatidylserine decarboxylase
MSRTLVFNRYTKLVEKEEVFGEKWLNFSHSSLIGRLTVAALIERKISAMIFGKWASSPSSVAKIEPFVKKFGLRADSFEKKLRDFTSFNDFFFRKLKPSARPISPNLTAISAPADGRHLAYEDMHNLCPFFVKGESIAVEDLTIDQGMAKKFGGGSVLVSRLSPLDYHRFHFPVTCKPDKTFLMNGSYASVHPIAMRGKVDAYLRNKRMSTILRSNCCGDILMVEIGAALVGSICQTFKPNAQTLKGMEKGYFAFGGSTVILIFEQGRIKFSDDLLENSANGVETYVLMGDEVATIANESVES